MTESFNYLFQYLEKEKISIDKEEFEFQVQSHPDYPSLLAISDTLSFFNIANIAARLDKNKIALLPNRFIVLLNEELTIPKLSFVEKKGENYLVIVNKIAFLISKQELGERWANIVLLIEKSDTEHVTKKIKYGYNWTLLSFILITFLAILHYFNTPLQTNLFFIFPVAGILFSFAALKDLFGVKIELINSFCSVTTSSSCNSVVNSSKWKIFEVVNFSDLSIIFFTSQFFGLLVFLFSGEFIAFFTIQKLVLLVSTPILFLSVYYQKFVERKWCPICLIIIITILLELGYLLTFQNTVFTISAKEVVVFGFVFLSVMIIWSALKKLLTQQRDLKEYQLKAIRFERNYTIFKNSLFAKAKTQIPHSHIILGNQVSETIITIISNPFCGHCKEAHEVIETILEKHQNNIQIQVILKTNLERENEESKKLLRSLMEIYEQDGEIAFIKALGNWFNRKNIEEWFSLFPAKTTTKFDSIFNSQHKWCEENAYNFTPAIFINGYEFPQMYDRKSLHYYINEIIEDNF